MHSPQVLFALLLLLIGLPSLLVAEPQLEAAAAFAQIKSLAGSWQEEVGSGEEESGTMTSHHDFEVSANGTIVIERMNPGSEHEMINVYHLDGEELVLTHYCSSGNQPTMKLDRSRSNANELAFDFAGGTNLDDADHFIGGAVLRLLGEKSLESTWIAYDGDKQPGPPMSIQLTRLDGEGNSI